MAFQAKSRLRPEPQQPFQITISRVATKRQRPFFFLTNSSPRPLIGGSSCSVRCTRDGPRPVDEYNVWREETNALNRGVPGDLSGIRFQYVPKQFFDCGSPRDQRPVNADIVGIFVPQLPNDAGGAVIEPADGLCATMFLIICSSLSSACPNETAPKQMQNANSQKKVQDIFGTSRLNRILHRVWSHPPSSRTTWVR